MALKNPIQWIRFTGIKRKKSTAKCNYAKHVLDNNYCIHFDINKDLFIVNKQKNMYLNSVSEQFLICNEVEYNSFYNTF